MSTTDLAVLAVAQPARDGISPLSATLQGGGVCLPASWPTAAAPTKRPRPDSRPVAGFAVVMPLVGVTKPGDTNIRQHTNMTRVYADGEGGSGPQPLRKPA